MLLSGLLAGMWEFPTLTLPDSNDSTTRDRIQAGKAFVSSLIDAREEKITSLGEIESIPWVFSHLKLTMHVHLFHALENDASDTNQKQSGRWASAKQVELESMGTGMRKCWTLVKDL